MENELKKPRRPIVPVVVRTCALGSARAYAREFLCSNECVDSIHLSVGMNE